MSEREKVMLVKLSHSTSACAVLVYISKAATLATGSAVQMKMSVSAEEPTLHWK